MRGCLVSANLSSVHLLIKQLPVDPLDELHYASRFTGGVFS